MNCVTCFLSFVQSVKRVKMRHLHCPPVSLLRIYHRRVPRLPVVVVIGIGIETVVITGPPETESRAGIGDMTEIGTVLHGTSE